MLLLKPSLYTGCIFQLLYQAAVVQWAQDFFSDL